MDSDLEKDGFPKLYSFAFDGYNELCEKRRRVDDCIDGQKCIKDKTIEYLPADKWQRKHQEDYLAYLKRALFFNYTRKTLNRYVGMLDMGDPTISFSSKEIEFLKDNATQYGDNLKALQRRINIAQLKHGLCCLLLESTGMDDLPFVIQEYSANAFLRTKFTYESGKSHIKFVLLDESGYEYDLRTKTNVMVMQMRVLGLDAKGEYYQATLRTPSEWLDFDIDNPEGDVSYPDFHGKRMNRIPFTWAGAYSLSGSSFTEPPIMNVADAEISLYQLYADYRQVMFMTGQSPLVIQGLKGTAEEISRQMKELSVGSGAVLGLPVGATAGYLEMAGASLQTIANEIEKIKELCTESALSIADTKSNLSGVAVQILQDSTTSPLQMINSVAGDAITEQLRYAAKWVGVSEEKVLETRYVPSRDFAKQNLSMQELAAIENSEILTFAEKRKIFAENGVGDRDKSPEEVIQENEEYKEKTRNESPIQIQNGNPFVNQGGSEGGADN